MHPFLLYLCLSIGSIILAVGAMFGEVAALSKSSTKVGFSIFVSSLCGGLLCSVASFFIGGLLAYPTGIIFSGMDAHNFSILSREIAYETMTILWLLFWLCGSILGAIVGGVLD